MEKTERFPQGEGQQPGSIEELLAEEAVAQNVRRTAAMTAASPAVPGTLTTSTDQRQLKPAPDAERLSGRQPGSGPTISDRTSGGVEALLRMHATLVHEID